jgi:hypothetical protein
VLAKNALAMLAYLDQMSSLLLERDMRESEEDSEVRTIERARTLAELSGLDRRRKTAVMHFLVEEALIQCVEGKGPIINLSGAKLSDADLSYAYVYKADLSDAEGITNEELEQQAASLEGATMPNGQRYQDWLKSKSRAEEG